VSSDLAEAPLVSVVVPCRGHTRELQRCLAGLEHQQVAGGFEIVVVDSVSDDAVAEIARSVASARLVRGEAKLLPGDARNLGAAHARGTYVCFIDADCTPESDWIAEAVNALEAGAKLVGGAVLDGEGQSTVASLDNLLQFAELPPGRPAGPARLLPTCNMALRLKDFGTSGGFPSLPFPAGEDTVFCVRASDAWGDRVRFAPSMRVSHFGRARLGDFAAHQDLFGYVRGRYGLELHPLYLRAGRSGFFLPAVVLKRLAYIARRTWAWNRGEFLRRTFLLPVLLYGLAAWARGFQRGCIERARNPETIDGGLLRDGE